ncbi:hypothetical protein [Nocardia fluminea]|nr:hypothetical protein [Nocardia fluminea]
MKRTAVMAAAVGALGLLGYGGLEATQPTVVVGDGNAVAGGLGSSEVPGGDGFGDGDAIRLVAVPGDHGNGGNNGNSDPGSGNGNQGNGGGNQGNNGNQNPGSGNGNQVRFPR